MTLAIGPHPGPSVVPAGCMMGGLKRLSMDATISELLPLILMLLAAGLVAGFLAGLFGVGGGAILVPVFDPLFRLVGVDPAHSMHVAVATSLAVIVPTSIRSYLAHRATGQVDETVLKAWVIVIPLGAMAASVIADQVGGNLMRGVFAAFGFLMGLKMLTGAKTGRIGETVPRGWSQSAAGFVIGLLSGLLGIGGGVLANLWMSLFGVPVHRAVATTSGVGVLIALPGLIAYVATGWNEPGLPPFSTGYVNWIAVALVIPVTLAVAPLGARTAHAWPRRRLEIAFGLFLIAVAIRFLTLLA